MVETWDEARIQQYIADSTEESLNLDYKAAASLAKTDGKKSEITKDVSAMANSDGGLIIYGLAEGAKHLPGYIDPVDKTQFSKEWLEQVINNIRPKIDGLIIHAVPISTSSDHVVYVVEIPQSYTAHQATDKRYYKRFNFLAEAMEDYEIRDVMGRRQYAHIVLEFKILVKNVIVSDRTGLVPGYDPLGRKQELKKKAVYKLKVKLVNVGKVYAQYVDAFIEFPCVLVADDNAEIREYLGKPPREMDLEKYCEDSRDNTTRDVVDVEVVLMNSIPKYGPARYVPILPGLTFQVADFDLDENFEVIDWGELKIKWTTHVDNAPPQSGEVAIKDIEIVDRRNSQLEPWEEDDED